MSADQIGPTGIVKAIRQTFPEEGRRIDEELDRDGYEDAPHIWIERFSQYTTDAIRRGDDEAASKHLKLLSRLLSSGGEDAARCIDVAYVESLMWDIKDVKRKSEGWRLIPPNLQALYVQMWGEKPFMKGAR
jgi:hypothetical protein